MAENVEIIKGASLWRDAWKRLLRNKLAVLGMVVIAVILMAIIIGPALVYWLTGNTYDSIPTDNDLVKSMPPSLQVRSRSSVSSSPPDTRVARSIRLA